MRAAHLLPALVLATSAAAQPSTLIDLGALSNYSRAFGVSPDGGVVVGDSDGQAFVWSQATGLRPLGGSRAMGASDGGAVICGFAGIPSSTTRSVRWTSWTPAGMEALDTFGTGGYSWASAISADGRVIVGNAAYSLTPLRFSGYINIDGLTSPAGTLPASVSEGPQTGALGVSADGSAVVGQFGLVSPRPFRWRNPDGVQMLATSQPSATAQAVNASGDVIAGYLGPWVQSGSHSGFLWDSSATPSEIPIPDLPGGEQNLIPYALSADGRVVVGDAAGPGGPEAFIWDRERGTRSLRQVLIDEGVANAPGWTLTSARGISADGRVIVGWGLIGSSGVPRAWAVRLGCYANCDHSAAPPALNVADFTCFLHRFSAGDPYANCDASTIIPLLTVADFTCYLQRFAAGCP